MPDNVNKESRLAYKHVRTKLTPSAASASKKGLRPIVMHVCTTRWPHDTVHACIVDAPTQAHVVEQAEGVAYFGTSAPALLELQRQVRFPVAHLVADPGRHSSCDLGTCVRVAELAEAIEKEVTELGHTRLLRPVAHRPSPIDDWYGGAYTDVGSSTPAIFTNEPEQRMLFQHLRTTRRENCYQAKEPSMLSVHVRDQADHQDRTGVYRGFVYIEHHHPHITGGAIAN